MEGNKILNPLSGRMIDPRGATAKSVNVKIQASRKLQAIIRRQITEKPEPEPKPKQVKEKKIIFNPLTGRKVDADGVVGKKVIQQKQKALVLEGAIKRKLTKKPKKPVGFEDIPEDVKNIITNYVYIDRSFEEDEEDKVVMQDWKEVLELDDYYYLIKEGVIKSSNINNKEDIDYLKRLENDLYQKGVIEIYSYTRKDRVEKIRDLSKEELNKYKGGIKYYPLIHLKIYKLLGRDRTGEKVYDKPRDYWIRGSYAEKCFNINRGDSYMLFPDGFIFKMEDDDILTDESWLFLLNTGVLFGNPNIGFDREQVIEDELHENEFYENIHKYLPDFELPRYNIYKKST